VSFCRRGDFVISAAVRITVSMTTLDSLIDYSLYQDILVQPSNFVPSMGKDILPGVIIKYSAKTPRRSSRN
jgi:hypothetical protein